jgi:hypothetical protein
VSPLPETGTTVDAIAVVRTRGPAAQRAFEAGAYHDTLFYKYLFLTKHPWQTRDQDPPPPPGANPSFRFDPSFDPER